MGPGVFRFEQIVIERVIKPGTSGNYALGEKNEAGEFIVRMVGRSDVDLRAELTSKLATNKYPYFKFSESSPPAAFEMECAHFHTLRPQIVNRVHPVPPQGTEMKCFLCGM